MAQYVTTVTIRRASGGEFLQMSFSSNVNFFLIIEDLLFNWYIFQETVKDGLICLTDTVPWWSLYPGGHCTLGYPLSQECPQGIPKNGMDGQPQKHNVSGHSRGNFQLCDSYSLEAKPN